MLFSNKNGEDSEILEELVALQNQTEETRLHDKLGKQKFHESI